MKTDIDATAATWVARLDGRPLSEQEQSQFDSWVSEDRRHLGAYARAAAVSAQFDRAAALGPQFKESLRSAPAYHRRWLLAAGVMLAGLVSTLFLLMNRPLELTTQSAQVRQVPLADHSQVTLNTSTHLSVDFGSHERNVKLLEGEALFDVAKDPKRPFVVEAGLTRVRAVGTSFVVSRVAGGGINVLVRQGAVVVFEAGRPDSAVTQIAAMQQVRVEQNQPATVQSVSAHELARTLNWQDGMIRLDGITLGQAAAEFAHYSNTRIVIDDPELASRTVTGRFSVQDPVGFARAVATSFDARVEVEGSAVHLRR